MTRRRDGAQRIGDIVTAALRPANLQRRVGATVQAPDTAIFLKRDAPPVGRGVVDGHGDPRRPAAQGQHVFDGHRARRCNELAAGRHTAQQVVKLALNRGDIRVDIRVIEFEIVDDQGARPVVNELGPFVEKRGVVFVGLDHEKATAAETRRAREIQRHTADQKTGLPPGVLQQPGQHAARRGLAVRARNRQHPAPGQHVLGQPLRPRGVGQTPIKHGLQRRIAPRQSIAHHDQGVARQVPGVVALVDIDTQRRELIAHGRVDPGIAAADPPALLASQHGQSAHERATDTENVKPPGQNKLLTHGACAPSRRYYRVRRWG